MKCPNCRKDTIRPVMTKQGTEIDRCEQCRGIWFDKGELFHFVKNPETVVRKISDALRDRRPVPKLSPRSAQPMVEITYPGGGPRIDCCRQTGGLWLDAGELRELLEKEQTIRIDEARMKHAGRRPVRDADRLSAGEGLPPLPNLFLRAGGALLGLYALLGAAVIAAVEFLEVDLLVGLVLLVIIALFQFLLSPFVMDMWLRCFQKVQWISPGELPGHLRSFVGDVCRKRKIKFPRFGMIDDGAPQAFTYGHTPGNARIILTRGILDILEPAEVEAVVAHEIGHAVHWDMLIMTVAQLVPMVLYSLYKSVAQRKKSKRSKDEKGTHPAIIAGAYILYIVSEYVVLWFSRTREYHADRFAGRTTGNPSGLAGALVKIAYGLAGQEKRRQDGTGDERRPSLESVSALGIFDSGTARALAVAGYSSAMEEAGAGSIDKDAVKGAMRWDLWNPWAQWYELNSTHPLVANRLRHLSELAAHMGQEPYVVFDDTQPESYWDEFFTDIVVHLLPLVMAICTGSSLLYGKIRHIPVTDNVYLAVSVLLLGVSLLVRFLFSYRGDFFPAMSVAALLKKVKVSAVRPVPCTLRGTVIGRGVPGYIFSEDFVMRDKTGIIFLDYRQPLSLWEFFFGLLRAGSYVDREVYVRGWYRRSPMPYVEIESIRCGGDEESSWVPMLYKTSAVAVIVIGLVLAVIAMF